MSETKVYNVVLSEAEFGKLINVLESANDCGSSFGSYESTELRELKEKIRSVKVQTLAIPDSDAPLHFTIVDNAKPFPKPY